MNRSIAVAPSSSNNQEAFNALPITEHEVSTLFDGRSFARSEEYVGNFVNIKSIVQVCNRILYEGLNF